MISIDHTLSKSVHEQLAEQLRFQIASGVYKIDQHLPSTRSLAEQLGISFHTVRKAYQELEREGFLISKRGSGYLVRERDLGNKTDLMERGAAVLQEAVQNLIGLGLDEGEIEYLLDEQFALLEQVNVPSKVIFAAPYAEMAETCASYLQQALQLNVEPALAHRLHEHSDADYVISPHFLVRRVLDALPRTVAQGTGISLAVEALDQVARLLQHETVGLVVYYADTVPFLMRRLKDETGFPGQILAVSLDDGKKQIPMLVEQTDLVLYTPLCERSIKSFKQHQTKLMPLEYRIEDDAIRSIRQLIPS